MADYVLGLDIGSSSVGWALIHGDENATISNGQKIVAGVRVFPEGVDRTNTGLERPRGQHRRFARGARRVHQRRRQRRKQLIAILQQSALLPTEPEELKSVLTTNPYPLRASGLDESLSLFEFGRTLFHLCQRRGFKSNRKQAKSSDDGKVARETAELQDLIEAADCRTLGEYLAQLDESYCHTDADSDRLRGRYTLRSMYEKEFAALWQTQATHHPKALTEKLKADIHRAIFYQRPLRFDPDVIGDCELEPGEKRASRSHWLAQQFRMLQEINLLKAIDNTTGEERPLEENERQILASALGPKKKMPFDRIRKLLDFHENQTFNLEAQSGRSYLQGNLVEASFQGRQLKAWYNDLTQADKDSVHEAVADIEDPDELHNKAIDEWNLTEEQAERILKINLPAGHFKVSLKAIQKMMPHLVAGHIYSEAKALAGYEIRTSIEVKSALPPIAEAVPGLRNPMVHRALTEVRKVVNSIIRQYGLPEKITVELARDLKNSARKRELIHRENRSRQRDNENIRETLIGEFNISSPSRNDVIKYKLWQECGQACPYTGKTIPASKLFSPEIQIEHILPYSRSLDNSYLNKTLCYLAENAAKLNRTPFEAYADNTEKYQAILQRAANLPWPKRRKFTQKEIDLDECVSRQLNDTRYISRLATRYLQILGTKVSTSKGGVTADLRRMWGLNDLLDPASPGLKTRDDHRHHAVDAAVVALSVPKVLHKLAAVRYDPSRPQLNPPWEDFRQDLAGAINCITVSHRPARKLAGALHKKTGLGLGLNGESYVYRVPVEQLTPAMVDKIRDPAIRNIVQERLTARGIGENSSGQLGNILTEPPMQMPSGVPIKRVRIEKVQRTAVPIRDNGEGEPNKFALPGSNHHIEIYEKPNGDWTGKAVSRFDAHKRLRQGQPIVGRNGTDGERFVMSLCINDMIELNHPETGNHDLYRIQKISVKFTFGSPYIFFRLHTAAKIDNDQTLVRIQSWSKLRGLQPTKVTVDSLGRVSASND